MVLCGGASWQDIAGETGSNLTLDHSSAGLEIRVSYPGDLSLTSDPTAPVVDAPLRVQGKVDGQESASSEEETAATQPDLQEDWLI